MRLSSSAGGSAPYLNPVPVLPRTSRRQEILCVLLELLPYLLCSRDKEDAFPRCCMFFSIASVPSWLPNIETGMS